MHRILYVSYPLLPVSDESAGGAEQMLSVLEREMFARGHHTAVAACDGSRVCGELIATGSAPDQPDQYDQREFEHCARTIDAIRERVGTAKEIDVVHDKSGSFWNKAAASDVPVLATLHLPRSFYRQELMADIPQNVYFNCVSRSQARDFGDLPRMLGVVANGIPLGRFPFTSGKRDYLLWVGRICEEKGTHVAIDVAARAGMPLVIAGQVYPFAYHQRYFESRVLPHLAANPRVQLIQSPSFADKVELLRNARAVLVPSLVDETSSLVSLEAMACGTPLIAFRRGAIPEVVADGETGILVDTPEAMVEAVAQIGRIDPRACRERVQRLFSARRMADEYEQLYSRVLGLWNTRHRGAENRTLLKNNRGSARIHPD